MREKGQGTGPFEITLSSGAKRWRVVVTMADGRRVWRTARTPREAERIHDLRHSTAHLMADIGVAESVRQSRLGHSTVAMARHYAGGSEEQDRLAAERLGTAIGGAG